MENSTIYINFNDTIQKAESLIELANQLRALSNGSLKETGSNLNGVWSGDAAEMSAFGTLLIEERRSM